MDSDEVSRSEERGGAENPAPYEPPMVVEAGTFTQDTRGGSGQYREAGVGRFF
ncbi:lasso RiPP family leader peptide-containing protein [Streptomyces sp. FH025]|uniref:lasso RiPP family leader peptide-containing protein n=1 Tax=Streptomyces sp. FH025 TaxID=2815937 RepID=UPI001A9DE13F|nr:lasso RiPP family leader peptide-containing protein [Streptomyces sp. FH025]MBO1420231.1 lasso RiPP family leader peptide-containing protein [Streptomyces sp. FH025]